VRRSDRSLKKKRLFKAQVELAGRPTTTRFDAASGWIVVVPRCNGVRDVKRVRGTPREKEFSSASARGRYGQTKTSRSKKTSQE